MTRACSLALVAAMLSSRRRFAQTARRVAGSADPADRAVHAGSSSDIVARIVAQKLGERLKQQIIVDNRVGASGNLGTEAVARAEPDGYTIGLANTSTHAVTASVSTKLGYDPVKDFAPVSMLGSSPFVLATFPGLPAKNVAGADRAREGASRTRSPTRPPARRRWRISRARCSRSSARSS